jgi:hypothetical protein
MGTFHHTWFISASCICFILKKKQRILQFHMYFSNYFSCNYFLSCQHWSTRKISQQNIYRPRQTGKITQPHVHSWVQGMNTVKRPKNNNNTKKKKQLQLSAQDPNPAKLKKTKENSKHQTSEKERTCPTASPGPQIINLSQTNTTNNRRTNEPANKQQPPNQ